MKVFINYNDPQSFASRLRRKRSKFILVLIESSFRRSGQCRILDVGGTYRYVMLAAMLATMFGCSLSAKADPPNSSGWVFLESLSDEFNGTKLDATKWYGFNPKWRGRPPSRFSLDNVLLRDGELLILTTRAPSVGGFVTEGITHFTGTIKSRVPIIYGYLEIRAKVAKSRASSAFWLYDHGEHNWSEIDIFEICGLGSCSERYNMNVHYRDGKDVAGKWIERQSIQKLPVSPEVTSNYIVAGLEWSPEAIRWYLNGRLVRTLENTRWHAPLYVVLDSEVMADWFGIPGAEELPAEFRVDYIRVWFRN